MRYLELYRFKFGESVCDGERNFILKSLKNNLEKEPKNWVIDSDEKGVAFKPLRVHHYANDYLLKYGDVVIFMSATILSHRMFSKWLGLNPNEVYHIKVDSPF